MFTVCVINFDITPLINLVLFLCFTSNLSRFIQICQLLDYFSSNKHSNNTQTKIFSSLGEEYLAPLDDSESKHGSQMF